MKIRSKTLIASRNSFTTEKGFQLGNFYNGGTSFRYLMYGRRFDKRARAEIHQGYLPEISTKRG